MSPSMSSLIEHFSEKIILCLLGSLLPEVFLSTSKLPPIIINLYCTKENEVASLPLYFYSSTNSPGSFIIFCGPDLLIITVNTGPGSLSGLCLVNILPLSFLCHSWEGLQCPVVVTTVTFAQFYISGNSLKLYSLTLRWCRYSWASPVILYTAMEVSGLRPKCQLLLLCVVGTNQVSQRHLQPCGWLQLLFHLWRFHSLGCR